TIWALNNTNTTWVQQGGLMTPFGNTAYGSQVAALDTNNDGISEYVVANLADADGDPSNGLSGDVVVKLFNGSNTELHSFTAETGVAAFGVSGLDRNQDGTFELMVGGVPSSGNLIDFFNPVTATGPTDQTGGYAGFPVL